jgi:hypothetical protein
VARGNLLVLCGLRQGGDYLHIPMPDLTAHDLRRFSVTISAADATKMFLLTNR